MLVKIMILSSLNAALAQGAAGVRGLVAGGQCGAAGAPDIMTVGGDDPNQKCKFPFIIQGRTYNTCQPGKRGEPKWCSTATDRKNNHITKSGKWGFCPENPKARPTTTPSPATQYCKNGGVGPCYCTTDRQLHEEELATGEAFIGPDDDAGAECGANETCTFPLFRPGGSTCRGAPAPAPATKPAPAGPERNLPDECSETAVEGACFALFTRWSYKDGSCQKISGCYYAEERNVFSSKAACEERCVPINENDAVRVGRCLKDIWSGFEVQDCSKFKSDSRCKKNKKAARACCPKECDI